MIFVSGLILYVIARIVIAIWGDQYEQNTVDNIFVTIGVFGVFLMFVSFCCKIIESGIMP